MLGRLIRGRRPRIEIEHPRLAISAAYLRDAHNKSLSSHTPARCAFDSMYFCFLEIAATRSAQSEEGIEHPNDGVVELGLTAISPSAGDRYAVKLLAGWVANVSHSLPSVTVRDACKLAERIHAMTVALLS